MSNQIYTDIYQGLLDKLNTGVGLPAITVEDNRDHKTKKFSEKSMAVFLLPAETNTLTLGSSVIRSYNGIFQIDFKVPGRTGVDVLYTYADIINILFKPYQILTKNDIKIHIVNVNINNIITDSSWTVLPTTIFWRVDE